MFHRPTGLEPDDELSLVITGLPAESIVTVNGQTLPASLETPPRFNVTSCMGDANRVEILLPTAYGLQPTDSPPPFPFDARLAIIGHS